MTRFWDAICGPNCERSIWIEQDDLGKEMVIDHRGKRYRVKIPGRIDRKVVLRLGGLGRTKDNKTGDLLLHVWLNKGDDIKKNLWLSETSVRDGAHKLLETDEKRIQIVIPPKSYDGLVIRLRGLGRKLGFSWRAPFLQRKRGNLLVKLFVYPDNITPRYGSFGMLATDDMALEGWVYRKIDEITHKMGESSFQVDPIDAEAVADLFNLSGWRAVFLALLRHLKLTHLNITLTESDSISQPGHCQRTTSQRDGITSFNYEITINDQFLDNPFTVAAIVAHELCHIVHTERILDKPWLAGYSLKTEEQSVEEERTVDLLVFMFKLGEFQLRVSRDSRLTLGYFNQDIFDRIQVIVSRKLGSL